VEGATFFTVTTLVVYRYVGTCNSG
jgi:hypothetical protein